MMLLLRVKYLSNSCLRYSSFVHNEAIKAFSVKEDRYEAWIDFRLHRRGAKSDKNTEFNSRTGNNISEMSWSRLLRTLDYPILCDESFTVDDFDSQCHKRFQKVATFDRRKWFRLADAFIGAKNRCSSDAKAEFGWKSRYLTSLTRHFLDEDRIAELTPEECVFCCFLASLLRQFPIIEKSPKTTSTMFDRRGQIAMPDYLVRKMLEILPEMSFHEVGLVCHAFVRCNMRPVTEHKRLTWALLEVIAELPAKVNDHDLDELNEPLSSVCKFLMGKRVGTIAPKSSVKILERFGPILGDLHYMTRIRLIHVVPKGSWLESRLRHEFINHFSAAAKSDLDRIFRAKDLAEIALLLFNWNHRNDDPIYGMLAEKMERLDLSDPRNGQYYLQLVTALAKKGHLLQRHVCRIFDTAKKYEKDFLSRDFRSESEMCRLARNLIFELADNSDSAPDNSRMSRLSDEKYLRRTDHLYRNQLVTLAELDCAVEIQHPDYAGTRLSAESRNKMLDLIHPQIESKDRIEIIAENLKQCFGDHVYKVRVLPHSTCEDVLCCFETKKVKSSGIELIATEIRPDYLESLRTNIVAPDLSGGLTWFVYITSKRTHYDLDGRPWGQLAWRQSQLHSLGYKTILVPFFYHCAKHVDSRSRTFLRRQTYDSLKKS